MDEGSIGMTEATSSAEAVERSITEHPCYWTRGNKLSHRHWFNREGLMPTCERCGTPIDREHKETGPVSWEPEKRPEVVTLNDRYAISKAAMDALGEWLVWPDAGRDGPREVTVEQTLSFLKGLPNTLGYRIASTPAAPSSSVVEAVRWRERWYGSEPQKGSAIVTERGSLVAYVGGDKATHKAVTAIVSAHNAAMPAASEGEPVAWRCFHCGDTFTDEAGARLHFGRDERSEAACVIKAGAEGSLLKALRDAEYQADDAIQRMHDESTDAAKAYHQQRCRHTQALTAAEELGYERGLADGRAAPSDQEKLADLLTKAAGDITAALTMAGKRDKIAAWTRPYVDALNEYDTRARQTGEPS